MHKNIIKAGMLLISTPTLAYNSFNDQAEIIYADKIEKEIKRRKPIEKCWTERVKIKTETNNNSATNEIVGALIGGAIGNQFGGGRGKDALTVTGAILGASIAHDNDKKEPSYSYKNIEKCRTTYEYDTVREFSHYDVLYEYQGKRFNTKMKKLPAGNKINITVNIKPDSQFSKY